MTGLEHSHSGKATRQRVEMFSTYFSGFSWDAGLLKHCVHHLPGMDLLRVGDRGKPRYTLSLWYAPVTVLCRRHLFNTKGDLTLPPPLVVCGHTGDVSRTASDCDYAAVAIYFVSI